MMQIFRDIRVQSMGSIWDTDQIAQCSANQIPMSVWPQQQKFSKLEL